MNGPPATDPTGLDEDQYANADEEEVQAAGPDGGQDPGQFPGFGDGSTGGAGAGGSWDPAPSTSGGDSGDVVDVVKDPNFGGSLEVKDEAPTVATEDASRGFTQDGGIFQSSPNAAGGDVFSVSGRIRGSDLRTMVNSGLVKGNDVNIITGLHGAPTGAVEAAPEFFAADSAAYGSLPGVTVYDFYAMTDAEMSALLEGTGTTILAWCDSACWLALF